MATPNPSKLEESNQLDQLMTWGEIISTPISLEHQVPEGPFKIPKTPRREELAMGMARQASKSLREKLGGGLGLGTMSSKTRLRQHLLKDHSRSSRDEDKRSWTPKREDTLSPAGKRLLKQTHLMKASTPSASTSAITPSSNAGGRPGIFTPVRNAGQRKLDEESMARVKKAKWDHDPTPSNSIGVGGGGSGDDGVKTR